MNVADVFKSLLWTLVLALACVLVLLLARSPAMAHTRPPQAHRIMQSGPPGPSAPAATTGPLPAPRPGFPA